MPERIAYRFLRDGHSQEQVIRFGELDLAARAAAVRLGAYCRPGDRVLILLKPGLDYVIGFLGCLYAGAIAVPAYPPGATNKLDRLDNIILDCDPAVAIVGQDDIPAVAARLSAAAGDAQDPSAPALPNLPLLDVSQLDLAWAADWRPAVRGADDIAFLQYTSGSTGHPKGVIVSHGNLVHNAETTRVVFGTDPDSHIVSWLPPYHDMGLVGGILHSLYIGFPATLMAPIHFLQRPLRWLQAVSRYRATISGGPNFAYELCVRKIGEQDMEALDLSHWRTAFNGAEYVRAHTLEAFAHKFARCGFRAQAPSPCYGLAEATLLVTGCAPGAHAVMRDFDALRLEDNQASPVPARENGETADPVAMLLADATAHARVRTLVGSGRGAPGAEPFICDPESEQRLEDGRVGEICVVGGSVAQGYWRRPDATAQAFRSGDASATGRYFRTGDLGFLMDGELFVTGRIKDLIIVNGVNHHPGDIESTLLRVDDSFRPDGSAAFSIELNDTERVVVIQEIERRALRRLDPPAVCEAIRAAIWQQHRLAQPLVALVFGGTLPRTSSGKVRRRQCGAVFGPLLQRLTDGAPATGPDELALEKRLVIAEIDGRRIVVSAPDAETVPI
jgi:acyl-CoA synthetase (AMP-forming)/AMP-acid ligase II